MNIILYHVLYEQIREAIKEWNLSDKRVIIANKNPYNEEYFIAHKAFYDAKQKLISFII